MSYILFQVTLLAYILATAAYMVYFWTQRNDIRTAARGIMIASGLLHTLYIIVRYFEAGHTPLTNHHETISFFAWSVTWGYLSFHWRYNVRNFGSFVSPVVTILMLIATFSSREIIPLPPALKSAWLPVHASIAIMANGFLALAFCGGIMYLLQERELKKKRFGLFYTRLPSLDALDNLNNHCLAVGFPLLTLGNLVFEHLAPLCRSAASALHRWLAGTSCRYYDHNRFFSRYVYPVGGDIPVGRCPFLCRLKKS